MRLQIKKAIDEVLIEKHMEALQADFLRMLKEDKNDGKKQSLFEELIHFFFSFLKDMRRLYFLLSRVTDGLPNSANTFQAYLQEEGTKKVGEQKQKALKEALANAVQFVKNVMVFYQKYYLLVQNCFSSHNLFKTALDKVS